MPYHHIKSTLVFVFFFHLFFLVNAQNHGQYAEGKIIGRIIDSVSNAPIEYASISLMLKENNKLINGSTTNSKGAFELVNIESGTYKMFIYFVGYHTAVINEIIVSKTNTVINLDNIKMVNSASTLKELTITSEKRLIENKIDKMVYNAEKDLTSQGGVATDILKKIPQVSVDINGNVELQGNANIRFLINGKPSSIFGNNLIDVLQSIPASQIQSVEIITNPGARYDAEGTGGIINIILKQSQAQGINGNISLSAGTRLENGAVNLNARKGKFGANAFASGNAQLNSTTINNLDRESTDPLSKQTSSLIQNGSSDLKRNYSQTGFSIDYSLTPKDNITAAVSYYYFGNNINGATLRDAINKDAAGNLINDNTNLIAAVNNSNNKTLDWNLNYKKSFKNEGQELDVLYSASDGKNYSYYNQTQKYITPDSIFSGSYSANPGTDKQTNISINYSHPLNKKVMFETGAKTVFNDLQSNAKSYTLNTGDGSYFLNTAQSNFLNYSRKIFAYYVSGTFRLKWLDIKAGCRFERTATSADYANVGHVNIKPYNTFVPSFVVSHTFENSNTIKLSYSHRIQRPDYRDLNPFINLSDPKNITTGNPNLIPEITDNIELGYNGYFKNGANINIALFYRGNKDDIQSYTVFYPTYKIGDSTYANLTVSTRENIGLEHNIGSNLFISLPLNSKINLRSNLSVFERYIINSIDPGRNINGFNYRINITGSYQISSTLSVEVFGNFNSPRINAQGKMPSFTTYNFALRKQFYHKKASIAFTATNPFSEYIDQKTSLTGPNFVLNSTRALPYRSFGINFTYKFGKLEFKKEKNAEDLNLTSPPTPGN